MNLIFRQQGPDHFSVYDETILINGEFKTQYIAELFGHHSGKYAIEETDSYIKALRTLASFKQSINRPLTSL